MKEDRKQDTINKSVLLNWIYSADKDVPIEELGRWITAKTSGQYVLVKKQGTNKAPTLDT